MSLAQRVSDAMTRIATEVKTRSLPAGGSDGQVLLKSGATPYVAAWGERFATRTFKDTLLGRHAGYLLPKAGVTGLDQVGMVNLTATGTQTALAPATTNAYTRLRGLEILAAAAATNAVAGYRVPNAQLIRGDSASVGGFYSAQLWGPAQGLVLNNRGYCGLTAATTAPTDVNPSTLVNAIGMGWDSADNDIMVMHNSGSGTATKVNTGMAVPTSGAINLYLFETWCDPAETKLNYRVTRYSNMATAVFEGNTGASANIPSTAVYLTQRAYLSTGGTSGTPGIGFHGLYWEGDPLT